MAYSVQVQRVTNINFVLTISVHNQKKRLWESIKWSPRGKCFDLLSNSLNSFFNKMYGEQTGEFVSGYWGLFNNIIWIFQSFQSFKVLLILLLSNLNVSLALSHETGWFWENKTSHKVFIVILTMACISNLFFLDTQRRRSILTLWPSFHQERLFTLKILIDWTRKELKF